MTDVTLLSFSNYKTDPKSVSTDKRKVLADEHSKLCNNKVKAIFDTERYVDASKSTEDKDAAAKLKLAANRRSTYQDKEVEHGTFGKLSKSKLSDAMKMAIYNKKSNR